jgi:uncharacterized protein
VSNLKSPLAVVSIRRTSTHRLILSLGLTLKVLLGSALGLSLATLQALAQAQTRANTPDANRTASQALFEALKLDDAKAVRALLLRGVDPNVGKVETAPAIVYAAAQKSFSALLALLESPGTDVDKTNGKNENALMLASFFGELATVKALIARGAEVNKTDWTPLHYAATAGHLEVARYLVEHHAFIDAMSPNKTTPLMMAARHKNPTLARYLIDEGADPTQRNENGWSVADYFERHGETKEADWFRARAKEFEAKYGTIQAPKTSPPPTR